MDALREWAVALCAAAVLCAAAGIIAPEEKSGKGLRIILASVMLCAVVIPLGRMTGCEFRYDSHDAEYVPDKRLCETIEQQTADAVSGRVEELISGCLDELSVEAEDIAVDMDISDDGCISIGQVTITVTEPYAADAVSIADALYCRLGLKAEVITPEEY